MGIEEEISVVRRPQDRLQKGEIGSRPKEDSCLGVTLAKLIRHLRIPDNGAPYAILGCIAMPIEEHSSYCYVELCPVLRRKETYCSRIYPSGRTFQLGDDLHSTDLRGAGNRGRREQSTKDPAHVRLSSTPDRACHLPQGRILFDKEKIRHLQTCIIRNLTHVVPYHIDNHDVFGPVLLG
ncbi:MAG: hypothetical protein A4E58_02128 [Syntrophorhabdus sp. PtaB.Bin006]|nr:MAG: hypothetical protein A4E58_02128 [Syntrophorhabdus sp. PtaB.Bin006]